MAAPSVRPSVATYSYLRASRFDPRDAGLALETSGGPAPHPRFFDGYLGAPAAVAAGLLAVTAVAMNRYDRTAEGGAGGLDPVVTSGDGRLRFESFSRCNGVYARLDVLPAGLDGDILGHGTTNVDVNPPLRAALTRVRGLDPIHLGVGPDEVTVRTFDGELVERKVPLPVRWLRGFAEAQAITAGFEARAELARAGGDGE